MAACPPPDAPDLGLAVCLLGFVRTLGERRVYESLANFRLQARHVDFFGVVSSGGEDTAKGQWADVDPSTLAPALARLRPVASRAAIISPHRAIRSYCRMHKRPQRGPLVSR